MMSPDESSQSIQRSKKARRRWLRSASARRGSVTSARKRSAERSSVSTCSAFLDALRCARDKSLLRQILVEKRRKLAEVLLRLRRVGVARVLRVRLALEHVKVGDDARPTQLAVHAHGVRQEQVARAGRQDRRREPA